MNNRNCKPSLRLVDGGQPSPWSIRGMIKAVTPSSAPPETMTQKFARQDAERAAKAAPVAPVAPAPVQPAAGISGYVGNAALQAREKAAGLRHGGELAGMPAHARGLGGEVEGPKGVDKVASAYTDGEFVASVPMLEKVPGLRGYLNDLRTEVLAEKGMTPEEADAKAVGGKTLRAVDGSPTDWTSRALQGRRILPLASPMQSMTDSLRAPQTVAQPAAPKYTPPPVDHGTGRYANGPTQIQAGEIRGAAQVGASPVGGGVVGAGGAIRPDKPAGLRGVLQTARSGVSGASQFLTGSGQSAGSVGGAFKSVAAPLISTGKAAWNVAGKVGAPLVLGTAAYDGFNTDTETYAKRLGLENTQPGLLRDLGVRSLGVASDVGNSMTLGLAKNYLYRDDAPSTQPAPQAPTLRTADQPFTGAPGPMGPQINPDAPSLRGRPGADVAGAPGVGKFVENGRTLYSNVAGDNASMMDGRQVGIVPGMPQAQIDRALTNPDGSRWGANDNAIMAANLRDGIDPYRGTSRQKGEDEAAQLRGMRELAFSKQGTPGRLGAMKMFGEQQQQQTLRQGQDLKYQGDIYNANQTAATARARQSYDMAKDQRDFGLTKETHDQNVGTKAHENTRKEFEVTGADNKTDLAASKQAFDAVRQIFPGIESADEATRNEFMPDAKEMHAIFQKARGQDKVGWDAMKFWEAKRPALSAMPDAGRGTTEQVGALGGLVTLNASNGDTLLRQKDGTTLNLGQLNSRQRELLERAKTQGWGK
ncbi:MAG: hypothetical protein Q8N51_05860 [Gammaproteobacteria bacterium]|nr:hypothetical protein [Gammaproteobacteria bacterium]